ncbi:MAG: hypothetical protein GF346_06940 [Candidatus Eisenbacteria bacterium]|nr:hypothetical protein [Candidatus Latescibacterota bacterium]MBD3302165.1 hypothetical protein [Candidatus Eisenbacteria bacterium]
MSVSEPRRIRPPLERGSGGKGTDAGAGPYRPQGRDGPREEWMMNACSTEHGGARRLGLAILAVLLAAGTAAAAPLSLQEAVEMALDRNPGLASVRYDLKSAEGSRLSSYNAFVPTVGLSGSFRQSTYRYDDPRVDLSTGRLIAGGMDESYQVQGSIRQNLIDLPSIYQFKASGEDVGAARASYRVSEADLIYQVRQQYYLLLQAIRLAEVAEDALEVSEEQLRKSEALFELGSVARTDVLQARVNRAAAVQEEISARNAVEFERAQLAILLGLEVGEPLEIALDVENPPAAEELEEQPLIAQAQQGLPEVDRARAQLAGAADRKKAAFWNQFPSMDGSLFYSKEQETFAGLTDLDDLKQGAAWGFGFGVSWNIFDGFNTIGNIKRTRANHAAAREELRRQRLAAALGVRQALIAIQDAREGVRAAEESVNLASENLKLQQALYENGGGTILELNNAQVEHTRARNSHVEAQVALHLAFAQLDRALGR